MCLALATLCQIAAFGCGGGDRVPLPREIVDLSPMITPDINIQRLGLGPWPSSAPMGG